MSSAFTTAPPPSNSAPASMETLLATIGRVVAKFEARLEAQEWRRATAFPPSRSEFDLPFGRPRTSWDPPEPPQKPAYSESYGGGDGYSNNYNAYHNNEPQAWFYNTYEPPPPVQYYTYESDRYNYVSQPVQYEPPPTAQYYSVVEPPQQPPSYYPQPPPDEVRPLIGFRQPSHAPQQLLPTQLAPWEPPWYRTAPDSSAGDPQPEGCTEWQPMTSVYGLSTDSQQNAPSSVPVTSNEEDEFEKWQGEVREAETRAEVEIEAGLDTKTEDEFVSGVVKTEEECVSDVEATIEGCALVAGRTDKGEIRVTSVSQVTRDFHPNFSAKCRHYLYIFPFDDDNVDDEVSKCKKINLNKPICYDDQYGEGLGEQTCEDGDEDSGETQQSGTKPFTFEVSRVNRLLHHREGKLLSFRMFARGTKASRNIGPPAECFVHHARAVEAYLPSLKDGVGSKVMGVELVTNRFLRKMAREDVFLDVWRRVVIFGLYDLAEVYKDSHLEDKVILKGGGVDTSRFNYFN